MAKQAKSRLGKLKHRGNLTEFSKGIRGKVLDKVQITNELECRVISLWFTDKTEVAITINISLMGKLELFDCKTGDLELIETLGRIPDEQWVFGTE